MEHKLTMVCVCLCCNCIVTSSLSRLWSLSLPPPSLFPPYSTGVLEIVAADEGDSGVYICTANGVSSTFTLSIEGPPPDGTYISHRMH